jgi:membrane-associated HD superfamily phosphohydrolase
MDPDIATVREEDFRYPGPKPRSKETALIMLADGVEAMSRLIDDPSPVRLREMIRKNVRDVLEDGQLDECEITLADLAKVEEAFFEVFSGMFHSRIEYPEEAAVPRGSSGESR